MWTVLAGGCYEFIREVQNGKAELESGDVSVFEFRK
jgi:hypothetical protein